MKAKTAVLVASLAILPALPAWGADYELYGGIVLDDWARITHEPENPLCEPVCILTEFGLICPPDPPAYCTSDVGLLANYVELTNPTSDAVTYTIHLRKTGGPPAELPGSLAAYESVRLPLDPSGPGPEAHYWITASGSIEAVHEIERLDPVASFGETLRMRYPLTDTLGTHVESGYFVSTDAELNSEIPILYLQNPHPTQEAVVAVALTTGGEGFSGGPDWDVCAVFTIPPEDMRRVDLRDLVGSTFTGYWSADSATSPGLCSALLDGAFAARHIQRVGGFLDPAPCCNIVLHFNGWAYPERAVPLSIPDPGKP